MPDTPTSDASARIWAFHLVVVSVAGGMFWSVSYPGIHFFLFAASACASVLVACFWLGWIIYVGSTRGGWKRWFLIGPAIGALTVVLLAAGAPVKLRWAASQGAFATVVAGHPIPPPGSAWKSFAVPSRLGLYSITSADWVPGGAIFYEANGAMFDDAGFAYLPGGPTRELNTGLFENPRFRHLGGGWYSWTASW
ncbi:hypothetical protein ABZS66_57315 [Dactylosporangium sp. NPDC005572]|uniref:hypothetical protein n=1 Tax=Dactylosporangium sp. NPDC005572 TaxID=3156889 RepID=UPI0033AF945B